MEFSWTIFFARRRKEMMLSVIDVEMRRWGGREFIALFAGFFVNSEEKFSSGERARDEMLWFFLGTLIWAKMSLNHLKLSKNHLKWEISV